METPMDLTAAEAAKLVRRVVPALDEAGKPTGKTKPAPIAAAEVYAVRVRDSAVTVITTDGQKLTGTLPAKSEKAEK